MRSAPFASAVELRDVVQELGLDARIGVNTGPVVAGEGDTLVTGDAVYVAARLEQAAGAGEVLLGDETLALVRDAVETERVDLEAEGKDGTGAGASSARARLGRRRGRAAPGTPHGGTRSGAREAPG